MPSFSYMDLEGERTLTFIADDGSYYYADSSHPNFNQLAELCSTRQFDGIDDMFNATAAVTNRFAKLGTEVSIRGNDIYIEGKLVHGLLSDKIVELYEADEDYGPFVKFMEKLHENPLQHSIDNLYRWLDASDFVLAQDGDIIAYKGLLHDGTSVHAAQTRDHLIHNGTPMTGHVPNVPGDVVEMDREFVQHDPSNGCSYGLHAGTWDYASWFGRVIVKVKINPKYVVSVPTDCSDQKMRVCRYQVIEVVDAPNEGHYNEATEYDDNLSEEQEDEGNGFETIATIETVKLHYSGPGDDVVVDGKNTLPLEPVPSDPSVPNADKPLDAADVRDFYESDEEVRINSSHYEGLAQDTELDSIVRVVNGHPDMTGDILVVSASGVQFYINIEDVEEL